MMKNLYNNFIRGITTNFVEWIIYNIIFTIHQITLFKNTELALFGQQGVLFALLYTTIALSSLGLDLSLAPFFSYAQQSKKNWRSIITTQLVLQIGIMGVGACIALYFYPSWPTRAVMLLFIGSTITEGLRKLIKIILHLSFKHGLRISLELGTLIIYVSLVWFPHIVWGISFSLYSLVLPFFIATAIGCVLSAIYLYGYYRTLPNGAAELPHSVAHRIITMRCNTALYSIGHQIFSGNILLPYIALHIGFATAGVWSLVQTLTQTITNLMHKISGFTAQAYLAHVKEESTIIKQQTFSTITNILNQIIYAIIIVLCIATYIFISSRCDTPWLVVPIIIYICMTIIEQWVSTYEKFYLNEERSGTLAIFNAVLSIASLLIMVANFSLTIFLTVLLALRIISFILLMTLSYRLWRIKPNWRLNVRYFIVALILMALIALIIGYKLTCID